MTTVQLKPCPFCPDNRYVIAINDPLEDFRAYGRWIECRICGAHGPVAHTIDDAAALWNRMGEVAGLANEQRRYWQEDREGRLSRPQ